VLWRFVIPDSIEPDTPRTAAVLEECCSRSLLVGKDGLCGDVIRITPMFSVSAEEEACACIWCAE